MLLKILLLEDDHIQRDQLVKALEKEFETDILVKSRESEFRNDFEQIASAPPDIAILDVMVRWAKPSSQMPARPAEVPNDPQGAGLRCGDMLRSDPRTASVKIIYYSVLSKDDYVPGPPQGSAIYLVKEPNFQELIDAVKDSVTVSPAS